MAVHSGSRIITDGLILHIDSKNTNCYPGTGNTVYDLSSSKVTGTLTNGASLIGEDFSFDGVNDTLLINGIPVNTVVSEGNTVEQWIYWNGASSQMPFTWRNIPHDIFISSNRIGINNGASLLYGAPFGAYANTWVHLVIYFPNGWSASHPNAFMYLNGVNIAMSKLSGDFVNRTLSASQVVGISGSYNGSIGNYPFGGKIPVTRVYNRQLTEAEILQNFNSEKKRYGWT